jgi:hypothetical protein
MVVYVTPHFDRYELRVSKRNAGDTFGPERVKHVEYPQYWTTYRARIDGYKRGKSIHAISQNTIANQTYAKLMKPHNRMTFLKEGACSVLVVLCNNKYHCNFKL